MKKILLIMAIVLICSTAYGAGPISFGGSSAVASLTGAGTGVTAILAEDVDSTNGIAKTSTMTTALGKKWPSMVTADGECLSTAPGSPVAGKVYCVAGGNAWDIALNNRGINELVLWDGASYIELLDEDGNLYATNLVTLTGAQTLSNKGWKSLKVIEAPGNYTFAENSGQQIYGGIYYANAAGTAAHSSAFVDGENWGIIGLTTANVIILTINGSDTIIYNGAALSAGQGLTSDGTTAPPMLSCEYIAANSISCVGSGFAGTP